MTSGLRERACSSMEKSKKMARAQGFLYLIVTAWRERWGRTLVGIFTVAFTVCVATVALFIGFGFAWHAIQRVQQLFPKSVLVVRPKSLNLAAFQFQANTIDEHAIERIRALRGVELVAPQLSLKVPLRAEGEIVGQHVTTDIVVVGVEPQLVKHNVAPGFSFSYDEQTSLPIPCLMPRLFLDMYNLAYADSLGLPKISEQYPLGKEFSLVLGETFLFGGGGQTQQIIVPCRIVGYVNEAYLTNGLIIPLQHAEVLNEKFHGKKKTAYSTAYVRLSNVVAYDEVTSAIRTMGFAVESPGEAVEKFVFIVRLVQAGLVFFTLLLLVIGISSIVSTYSLILLLRRSELAVLLAVGATRRFVFWLLVADVAGVAFVGSLIGALVARLTLRWTEQGLGALTSGMSFIPTFSAPSWWYIAMCGGVGGLVVLIALLPLLLQSRLYSVPQLLLEEL